MTEAVSTHFAASERSLSRFTVAGVSLCLLLGIVFRLMLRNVIEYHGDEAFSLGHLRAVLDGGPWPAVGMQMSIGGANPGLSAWIFILLGLPVGADSPPELARMVQLCNVAALLLMTGFVASSVEGKAREPWLWAIALWAVNPLAVVHERKIWPPSTLPVFMTVMIAAWWYRRYWLASFAFAAIAMLAGQIHPTGFFLGFSILAWTFFADRRSLRPLALIAGAVAGLLPAFTWFLHYHGTRVAVWQPPWLSFYIRWFSQPFTFGPDHTLGPVELPMFLATPVIGGVSTYVPLILEIAASLIGLTIAFLAARRLYRWRTATFRWLFVGDHPAGWLVRAAFFGFGTILTVLTVRGGGLYPHYLIVVVPLMMLFVTLAVAFGDGGTLRRRGRGLLAALCLCNALTTGLLYAYLDERGNIFGEFGPSWAWQQEQEPPPVILPTR